MNRKARVLALFLALLLIATTMAGALSYWASAADEIQASFVSSTNNIQRGRNISVVFSFVAPLPSGMSGGDTKEAKFNVENEWWDSNSASIKIKADRQSSGNNYIFEATINNLRYSVSERNTTLSISSIYDSSNPDYFPNYSITVNIPSDKFASSVSSEGEDDYLSVSSDIVVENAIAIDSKGNKIEIVTKDTEAFDLEVTFVDVGLQEVDNSDIKQLDMQAYITASGGFLPQNSNRGTVTSLGNRSDYPRFRVVFRDIKYDGSGNSFTFRIQYILDEVEGAVGGEATATVYAAKTDEDDEDKEIAPATPYIIINQYSYGNDQIEAGNEFQLDISFHNTSADIQVENIVMTVTPPEDLTVASSSNTVFIPFLEAGGTLSHTIALKAKASAEATSHSVQISFNYDYIDTVNEERKSVTERSEEIAIPVTQIDRFSVDPITESPYAVVGEETYLTVSFINRGKSITYNISGIVRCDDAVSAPSQHFGNLEAGKAETLDFYLTGSEAGVYNGDIVIQYEDENNNQKEISTPFTFTVDELPVYEPPYIPDEEWEEPQPPGPGALSIVLFVLGGLAIAAPIALYLMKLVKEKGKEDFDEDF